MADFIKDPDAELDYARDWSAWLADGETISSSTWTIPTGLLPGTGGQITEPTKATVWIKGGTVGQEYAVANRITTSAGRVDERTFVIRITQR